MDAALGLQAVQIRLAEITAVLPSGTGWEPWSVAANSVPAESDWSLELAELHTPLIDLEAIPPSEQQSASAEAPLAQQTPPAEALPASGEPLQQQTPPAQALPAPEEPSEQQTPFAEARQQTSPWPKAKDHNIKKVD